MATITLPYQQTSDRQMNQFQKSLSQALAPVTNNPVASCTIIPKVSLTSGQVNQIPIGLSSPLQGWFIVRQRGQASVWDTQDSNSNNSSLLFLNTSANVTVDLAVF